MIVCVKMNFGLLKIKKLPSHDDRQKKNVSSYGCAGLLLQIGLDLKAIFTFHAPMENCVFITYFNGFVIVIHEKCKSSNDWACHSFSHFFSLSSKNMLTLCLCACVHSCAYMFSIFWKCCIKNR